MENTMPIEDIPETKCPVCDGILTDMDGLIECQNSRVNEWHFFYFLSKFNEKMSNETIYPNGVINVKAYFREKCSPK